METYSEEFNAVLEAIDLAWSRYPNGETFESEQFKQELDDIFGHYGGYAEENSFEWYFHSADKRSYLRHKLRPEASNSRRPALNKERGGGPSPAQSIGHLGSMARAKRPLSSAFCKGMAKAYLNQAMRVYKSGWLTQKGVGPIDPVGALRRRRLKPADHELIRTLITNRIIPALSHQRHNDNAAKLWKRSMVLELAELYLRYAPPTDENALGIAMLPAGGETLFIKFLSAALAYFDPDIAPNNQALAAFWLHQKRTMRGLKNQTP